MGSSENSPPHSSRQGITGHPSSIGRISIDGFGRRDSMTLSRDGSNKIAEDILDTVFAQAGDSGNRIVDDGGRSVSQKFQFDDTEFADNVSAAVIDDASTRSDHFRIHPEDHPLPEFQVSSQVIPPLPPDAILYSREKSMSRSAMQILRSLSTKERQYRLPRAADYFSYLIHLAVFGILGAMTRHLLQKLFGPHILAFTSDQTSFYLDLPSNMVGSFLMGWLGIVFKGDIAHISDHLAVGLTTGYLESLTTFSGWNQKMIELSSDGSWVFAIAGLLLGMLLVNESINVGVESARWLRKCILSRLARKSDEISTSDNCRIDRPSRHMAMILVILLILICLLTISGVLAASDIHSISTGTVLWIGCLVGPVGVWIRWYLARLNGRGIGKKKNIMKWLPFGTLAANVLAACIMAALATINKAVNTKKTSIILKGIQFGFLGCMSTVSTFAAEVYAMRQSGHPGRALAYVALTLVPSFAFGTLIYSVPVWKLHFN